MLYLLIDMSKNIKIAVIKPNTVSFEKFSDDEMKNIIFDNAIIPHINLMEISNDTEENTMQQIFQLLDPKTGNETLRSHKCYENKSNSFYSMYITDTESDNSLGRLVSYGHEFVKGNCIILKIDKKTNVDITINDVIELFRCKFVHTAIIMTPNSIEETKYIKFPIENTKLTDLSCRCIQIDFLGKILCVFIETNPVKTLNKNATILCRSRRVNGTIIVSMLTKIPSLETANLDIETFNDILCIKSNTSNDELTKMTEYALQNNFYQVVKLMTNKSGCSINDMIPDDVLNSLSLNETLFDNENKTDE